MADDAEGILVKHIRRAIAKSATALQEYARENHRFTTRTGALERSVSKDVAPDGFSASVYLDENIAKYGPMIHMGTPPHVILPRYKKVLRWSGGDGFVFAKHVRHPGTKPDPFLYDAIRGTDGEIQNMVKAESEKAAQEVADLLRKDVMK